MVPRLEKAYIYIHILLCLCVCIYIYANSKKAFCPVKQVSEFSCRVATILTKIMQTSAGQPVIMGFATDSQQIRNQK